MDGVKQWYLSKTVWGALIAVGASVLKINGFSLDTADQSAMADALVSIAGAAGGLLAIYGRLTANTLIKTG